VQRVVGADPVEEGLEIRRRRPIGPGLPVAPVETLSWRILCPDDRFRPGQAGQGLIAISGQQQPWR